MKERARTALNRRELMKMAGLSGLGVALTACGRGFGGGGDPASGKTELNMVWWGDADRAEKTQAALDLFMKQNPTIAIKTEYQDSGPYKDKLATRFAAGNPPDLMMMRMDSLREYADRKALLNLNDHAGAVDMANLSQAAKGLTKVGDATYGIPSGLNTIGFVVNKAITDQYGVTIPDGDAWSWEDLAEFAKEVTDKSNKKVYGTLVDPATMANVIVYVAQQGEDFFTADGRFGVSEATLTKWFQMFEDMRKEGGFPPAGFVETTGSSPEQSYIAKGTIASQIIPTNNFLRYNQVSGGNLQLLRIPGEAGGERRGMNIGTPALWSIAAASQHPAEALKLLNFLINDVAGGKAMKTTRGVPASSAVADAIKPSLDKDDQVATDYLIDLQKETLLSVPPYPVGASAIQDALSAVAPEVEHGRVTSAEAAKKIIDEAAEALSQ
ncbi:ABC transporter substrate-binding protein [Nonomuraea diastatica]|uniref:Extracellular solute-binding protein n=1 Tax=Nonomuraea diastatica TaxID=1848329 RepID=A0A4R4W862_9ACTN|nr:extracellular solute-binding protein [Nonomuraea diastatica]TDD14241.1 extracellular solute-binding protein [Nonomuraea diastatica]